MKRGILIGGAWLLCVSAHALEPATAPSGPTPAAPVAQPEKPRQRLNLRVGDVRKYMTPEEYRALVAPPDESNTVIVQADAPEIPMKSQLDVPGGLVAPFWALANPHKAWRLFLPDPRVNIKNIPPPETKVPPPVFRWGP
jgi:hypothetical protein